MLASRQAEGKPEETHDGQEGRKMKQDRTEFINAMKQQTIGCEIEMAEIRRDAAIKVAADYFGTQNTVQYEGLGYKAWSCLDNKGRKWLVMRDSSIRASDDDKKAELTTPILTYDDIEDLQEIVRRLRHAGAISNPNHGCGVHIHIGANGHTPQTLRNLVNIMAAHEALLTHAIYIARSRTGHWCQPVDPRFLQAVNAKKPKTMTDFADVWYTSQGCGYGRNQHYNDSRYHMLNLHATFTKGTVEFRLFQFDNPHNGFKGGLHAGRLKAYIQLALAINQQAKTVRTASPKVLTTDNPKYAMRCWLLRLGFIGDEFATARDQLTKKLPGDAAFRNGRPQRAAAADAA